MTAYEQAPITQCRLTLRFKDPALALVLADIDRTQAKPRFW